MVARLSLIGLMINTALSEELSIYYEAQTAEEKLDELWSLAKSPEGTSGRYPYCHEEIQLALFDDVSVSFTHFGDKVPYKRNKRVHPVGGVSKAVWKSVGNHTYSGQFQEESPVFLRYSTVRHPDYYEFTPSIAVKFLRDGMPSGNLVAANTLLGQQSGSFFQNTLSNHLPKVDVSEARSIVGRKFAHVNPPGGMVGLSDIAKYDQYGVEETNVNFPFQLFFVPNHQLTLLFHNYITNLDGLFDHLTSIPPDVKLWDVYAISHPEDTNHVKIAELISSSEVVYSGAGDHIFFRHQMMMEDVDQHPEWYDHIAPDEDICSGLSCPFLVFSPNPGRFFGA